MRKSVMAAAGAAMVLANAASAQEMVYWPAPATIGSSARTQYFPMGTPVRLSTRTQVSSKYNKPGDRVYFDVAEPLTYQGQTVVPAGSLAVGEVADIQRNGHFGVKGKLAVRLLYMQTPGGPVRITGRSGKEGTSGTAASVATIVFVSWLGFLIHGTSAKMPSGTVVNAQLADDLSFAPQRVSSRPVGTEVAADSNASTATPRNRNLPARFDPSVFGNRPSVGTAR